MQPIEKKDIWFSSADGQSRVSGCIWASSAAEPFCVLQIAHGMCEYMGRYDHFARAMARQGVVVCGHDHLGHGGTAETEEALGYFSGPQGRRYLLEDMRRMNHIAREAYPGLPVMLLGHSMGSFLARRYAAFWPGDIDALLLSGTGGARRDIGLGIAICALQARLFGGRHRSRLVRNLAFGGYLLRIPNPGSIYDWISTAPDVVHQYKNDPYCRFTFTVNGFSELFNALRDVSSPDWAAALPQDLPVLLFSGGEDPVGGYGKGVRQVYRWLQDAGVHPLELKLYPGKRHEMLNEVNRDEVYADVLAFIRRHVGASHSPQ